MSENLKKIIFNEPFNDYNMINNDNIKQIFPNLQNYKNENGYWINLNALGTNQLFYENIEAHDYNNDNMPTVENIEMKQNTNDTFDAYEPLLNLKSHQMSTSDVADTKPDPGDGLPKRQCDYIAFKWNHHMNQKRLCDTRHMLYLLQLA
eukprot:21228_1